MLSNYHPDLRRQVLQDLHMRARGGIVVYLVAWFFTAFWGDMVSINAPFFYINSTILISLTGIRLYFYLLNQSKSVENIARMANIQVTLVLLSALHWGIVTGWIMHIDEFSELRVTYVVMVSAFVIGGTSILSISREIRILYPLLTLGPMIAGAVYFGGRENHLLIVLALFALIYVFEASRVSANDYRSALESQQVANEHAQIMERMSITDPLTQLYNRMYFDKRYVEEIKCYERLQLPLCIMMIDLDNFKQINDNYGHVFGDKCLQHVADVLKKEVRRETDTLARYGGEEFVVLLPDMHISHAEHIARRLLQVVNEIDLRFEQQPVGLSCSIGLTSAIPDRRQKPEFLLIAADQALYQAKHNGRNQFVVAN